MQINDLKRKTENKKTMKVGRGGKRGKTSGRGTKGQLARSGRKLRPELRDLIKKIPKLRGRGKNSFLSIQIKPAVVNVGALETHLKDGDKVTPATLEQKGVIKHYKGRNQKIKILGSGELTKKLNIVACLVSETAKQAIEKAGGSVK